MKTIILILLLTISLIHAERIPVTKVKFISFNANEIILNNGSFVPSDTHIICNVFVKDNPEDTMNINRITRCYSNKYLIMKTDIHCDINENHEILQDRCAINITPILVSGSANFLYDIIMMRLGEIPDHQLVVYDEYELTLQVFTNYLLCNDNFVNVIIPLSSYILYLFESSSLNTQSNLRFVLSNVHKLLVQLHPIKMPWVCKKLLNFLFDSTRTPIEIVARFALVFVGMTIIMNVVIDLIIEAVQFMYHYCKRTFMVVYKTCKFVVKMAIIVVIFYLVFTVII